MVILDISQKGGKIKICYGAQVYDNKKSWIESIGLCLLILCPHIALDHMIDTVYSNCILIFIYYLVTVNLQLAGWQIAYEIYYIYDIDSHGCAPEVGMRTYTEQHSTTGLITDNRNTKIYGFIICHLESYTYNMLSYSRLLGANNIVRIPLPYIL